jgi:2-haloacid dehalogenase
MPALPSLVAATRWVPPNALPKPLAWAEQSASRRRKCGACRREATPMMPVVAARGAGRTGRTDVMAAFRPKYITFDCYGTLTNFDMAGAARRVYGSRLAPEVMERFIEKFAAFRLDEVLGAWKPYGDVVSNAVERSCKNLGIPFDVKDAERIYAEVPSWGPHPDVTAGLAQVAGEIPLVILSNSMDNLIMSNVEKLGVPFHKVITAEETGAYKPQMRGFEYMLDALNCGPEDITHVSSSFRYDLMTAYDLGIKSKVWVNRGHEPANPYYEYTEVKDVGGLAAAVGLRPAKQDA